MFFSTSLLYQFLLPTAIVATPSQLLPRKSTSVDPFIFCVDPPPVAALPPNYLPLWYPTTLSLCSALEGAARNVGCLCHTSTGVLHCDMTVADTVLWNTRVNPTSTNQAEFMHQFCSEACYCTTAQSARWLRAHQRDSTRTRTEGSSATNTPQPTLRVPGVINVPWGENGPNPFAAHSGPFPIGADATGQAQGGTSWWHNQCGVNCTSNQDCNGGGDGCMCLAAQKSTYQPNVGAVAFVAACIVSLAASGAGSANGVGGKRSLEEDGVAGLACPCNATYVSQRCCEVRDGLVWEGEEFKLGELVKEYEL